LRRRQIANTTFNEPPDISKRTFSESLADLHLWPRFKTWLRISVVDFVWFQIKFRIVVMAFYFIRQNITGEDDANDNIWFWNVYKWWYDWVVGLTTVTVKRA
jgi:hypothetical protein